MKRSVMFFGLAVCFCACGNNDVGNRTYDMNTRVDSPNYQVGNTHDDTTATTNNNIYNPDSMPSNTNMDERGSSTGKTTEEQGQQQRTNAGASVPQNSPQQ